MFMWSDSNKVNILEVFEDGSVVFLEPGADRYDFAKNSGPVDSRPVTEKVSIEVPKDAVKVEAYSRIISLCPEWKQRNLTARAAELSKKGEENWTPDEKAEWDAGQAIWDQIKHIRSRSDTIEAMDPIPRDYTEDKYWP